MTLDHITAIVCSLAALRLIMFERAGSAHRPYASLLAYLLTVAFGALALLILFGQVRGTSWPQFAINLASAGAIWTVRGNVVELFRRSGGFSDGWFVNLIRRTTWF